MKKFMWAALVIVMTSLSAQAQVVNLNSYSWGTLNGVQPGVPGNSLVFDQPTGKLIVGGDFGASSAAIQSITIPTTAGGNLSFGTPITLAPLTQMPGSFGSVAGLINNPAGGVSAFGNSSITGMQVGGSGGGTKWTGNMAPTRTDEGFTPPNAVTLAMSQNGTVVGTALNRAYIQFPGQPATFLSPTDGGAALTISGSLAGGGFQNSTLPAPLYRINSATSSTMFAVSPFPTNSGLTNINGIVRGVVDRGANSIAVGEFINTTTGGFQFGAVKVNTDNTTSFITGLGSSAIDMHVLSREITSPASPYTLIAGVSYDQINRMPDIYAFRDPEHYDIFHVASVPGQPTNTVYTLSGLTYTPTFDVPTTMGMSMFSMAFSNNTVMVQTFTPTPEPSSILLVCTAATMSVVWIRKRRKNNADLLRS